MWCQNDPSGYLLLSTDTKAKRIVEIQKKKYSEGALLWCHLLYQYSDDKVDLPYCFNFDNSLTSLPLIHELQKRGYSSLGTIRQNRLGKDCPLVNAKSLEKQARGSFDGATASFNNNHILLTRWTDNAVLTLG